MDKNQVPDLMSVYRSMAGAAAMEVTSDGYLRMSIGEGEYLPVVAKEGKSVVIPLPERLRDPNIDKLEVFHLLSENTGSKSNASDLLSRYRHWLISRYNIVLGGLGEILLNIAADKALSKRLRPDQADYLQLVDGADKETVKVWNKISEAASKPNQVTRVFMSMYIRNAAVLDGKSYGRVTSVSFPFYDELKKLDDEVAAAKALPKSQKKKVENEVFDIALRVKDRPVLMGLMHYLIPGLDVPHAYDVGSNSKIAPSIDSMMRAFYQLAKHVNEVIDVFMELDPGMDVQLKSMKIDTDWYDAFENLEALWPQIRMTPMQNQGVIDEPTNTAPTAAAPAQPVNTPPWGPTPAPTMPGYMPPPPQMGGYPAPLPTPPARPTGRGASVTEMMHSAMRGGRMQPQQGYGGYPQPMGQQYPNAYPAPQQNMYQQTQYPGVAPQGFPNYPGGRRPY